MLSKDARSGPFVAIQAGVILALVGILTNTRAETDQPVDAPEVKVVSPHKIGYVVGSTADRKALVVVEITDVAGAGIRLTDSGMPYWVAGNRNVATFASHMVGKSTYTNKLGQQVLQIASMLPLNKLKMSEGRVTPPIDYKKIQPAEGEKEFTVPWPDMVEFAMFNFQVEDLRGVRSESGAAEFKMGFTQALWAPKE